MRHSSLAVRHQPDVFRPMFSVHVNRPLIPDESLENQARFSLTPDKAFYFKAVDISEFPFPWTHRVCVAEVAQRLF